MAMLEDTIIKAAVYQAKEEQAFLVEVRKEDMVVGHFQTLQRLEQAEQAEQEIIMAEMVEKVLSSYTSTYK